MEQTGRRPLAPRDRRKVLGELEHTMGLLQAKMQELETLRANEDEQRPLQQKQKPQQRQQACYGRENNGIEPRKLQGETVGSSTSSSRSRPNESVPTRRKSARTPAARGDLQVQARSGSTPKNDARTPVARGNRQPRPRSNITPSRSSLPGRSPSSTSSSSTASRSPRGRAPRIYLHKDVTVQTQEDLPGVRALLHCGGAVAVACRVGLVLVALASSGQARGGKTVVLETAKPGHEFAGLCSASDAARGAAHGNTAMFFVSDSRAHCLRRVEIREGGAVRVCAWAGAEKRGLRDGPLGTAHFNKPSGLGLAPDGKNVLVADEGNHAIRFIDVEQGQVVTLVGGRRDASSGRMDTGHRDGPLSQAAFEAPCQVLSLAGSHKIYVLERGGGRVRCICLRSERVSTVCGGLSSPTAMVWHNESRSLLVADASGLRQIDVVSGTSRTVRQDFTASAMVSVGRNGALHCAVRGAVLTVRASLDGGRPTAKIGADLAATNASKENSQEQRGQRATSSSSPSPPASLSSSTSPSSTRLHYLPPRQRPHPPGPAVSPTSASDVIAAHHPFFRPMR